MRDKRGYPISDVVRDIIDRGAWTPGYKPLHCSMMNGEGIHLIAVSGLDWHDSTYRIDDALTFDEVRAAVLPSTMHAMRFARDWCVRNSAVVAVFLLRLPPRVQCMVLATLT